MFERCLVVDDHQVISETITIMLNSLGINDVIIANDGAEAISKLYHEHPTLIITDLQMEPIDGLEMLKIIRSGRYNLPYYIPVIVLTSNAATEIIKECIVFDVDAFIVKPVNKKTLQNRIDKLTQQPKLKKDAKYYYDLYKKDPLKITEFIVNQELYYEEHSKNEIENKNIGTSKKNDLSIYDIFKDETTFHFIKWQKKYSVGNSKLDQSNKFLLSIINEAYSLLNKKNSNTSIYEKLSKEFDQYIQEHFLHEEDLLKKNNYDNIQQHKKIHHYLKQKAEYVLLKCQANPELYRTEFIELLKYWWLNHIVKEDIKYKYLFMEQD